jgi:hypothetical protein
MLLARLQFRDISQILRANGGTFVVALEFNNATNSQKSLFSRSNICFDLDAAQRIERARNRSSRERDRQ